METLSATLTQMFKCIEEHPQYFKDTGGVYVCHWCGYWVRSKVDQIHKIEQGIRN